VEAFGVLIKFKIVDVAMAIKMQFFKYLFQFTASNIMAIRSRQSKDKQYNGHQKP
jgi:hypothetical protein